MRDDSKLTQKQREAAVDLFEQGYGEYSVAKELGVSRFPIHSLFDRWLTHGRACLTPKKTKTMYSMEFKKEIVRRYLSGETARMLTNEFEFSSEEIVRGWVRLWRKGGDKALRSKKRGPRRKSSEPPTTNSDLRAENERLRAEVAYLKNFKT
ncbi:helix-turn-helix domain-containing protein [Actinomyces vulturis]|uniref:helix-turn-helix domain-containing protein n=1 Tax=Actinomyces vulturis TaxID=1857645 RepID=UPI0008367EEA|nr:helix-turn-helix domain-containing protein [Actinomyces vulturis]